MMSAREEVYTRHGGKGGDRGKRLAEMMKVEGKPEALDDILVLDVSSANFGGIVAASFFAEFGAEVVKIEPPDGDPARQITPFGVTVQGVGIPFMFEGRNKRYMTLDIRNNEEDRVTFSRLAQKAAVVIESFAPGEMDGWGIGYRQLCLQNPGLIYIVSGLMASIQRKPKICKKCRTRTSRHRQVPGFRAKWAHRPTNRAAELATERRHVGGLVYLRAFRSPGRHASPMGKTPARGRWWMWPVRIRPWSACRPPSVLPGKVTPANRRSGFHSVPMDTGNAKTVLWPLPLPATMTFAPFKILGLWEQEDDWRYSSDRAMTEQAIHLHRIIEEKTILFTGDELVKMGNELQQKISALQMAWWRGAD